MELSTELTQHDFTTVKKGGYDPGVVDDYLEDASFQVARLEEQLKIARTRIAEFEKRIQGDEDAETVVQTAFLAAAEVKAKMLEEAEAKAAEIVAGAEITAGGSSDVDGLRQEATEILMLAKTKLEDSEAEAQRRIDAAEQQADEILTMARRQALTPVGESQAGLDGQLNDAREELQRLVFMIRSLKSLVREGFSDAGTSDGRLKQMLDEAETLVEIVDGDQVDSATV